MKKLAARVALGVAALSLVAAPMIFASHTVTLTFSANPAPPDTTVQVTFSTTGTSGNAKLFVCFAKDGDGNITTVYTEAADCGTSGNAEELNLATGGWVGIDQVSAPGTKVHNFSTAGLAGHPGIGFYVQDPPLNHTPPATTFGNLVVQAPLADPNGEHKACSGLERAYENVTTNGAAKKGKAAEVLERVAEKLGGCSDIP